MNKCFYYLSNGLWKVVECYFDVSSRGQNEYFCGLAVIPDNNSFGSHIISTPWQQSWITLNILEKAYKSLDPSKPVYKALDENDIQIVRKEVDFQYTLRNFSSDSFVQELYNDYSRIQNQIVITYTEAEFKAFLAKLKLLFNAILKDSPSSAHTLTSQMLEHILLLNCCEGLLNEIQYQSNEDDDICCLLLSSFCKLKTYQFNRSVIADLSKTEFQNQLYLLLIASDNISLLQYISNEEKKLFKNNSTLWLSSIIENGLQPCNLFQDMVTVERHFLFLILDVIKDHIEDFSKLSKCQNIPSFIWPLILLQCWDKELLSDDILLQLIDKCKESTKDKTIVQITFILDWYLNFCKWYEQHGTSEHKEKEHNLLQKAKEHSVLYLINNTTDLSVTDWAQIQELLKQGKSKIDVEKPWDIVLFDSYRILMLVLHAILSSTELDQLARAQKTKLSEMSFLNETFKSLYNEEVTERLKLVKKMIKSLYPLIFRLEILENVFALIFINFEDVKNVSYFIKGTLDSVKHLEKIQGRSKSVPTEKAESGKVGRSFSLPPHQVLTAEKADDEGGSKKGKLKGFICRKYVLRDLIYLVKECLEELEEDPNSQMDKLQANVPCSVKSSQFENRLDRLTESVSEATWRLQLVTDPEFISQIGVMQYACGQDPYHHFDPEWLYMTNEQDRSGLLKARKKSSAEKGNDSGSQSQSSPGNGNSSSETQGAKHKPPGPGIMNQMLACDSSLIVHCLSQGDVLNADHIIQMMSTEENRQTLEGELHFTESIKDLKKKLQNISLESPTRKPGTDPSSKLRNLQSIQMIANQGVTSTALTNHVERFLSVTTLPSIQGAGKVSVGSMLQCIENASAVVAIDLALTSAVSYQDFSDLLNIASKHCPELSTRVQPPISAQTAFSKPLGYVVFSQNIIALLQEVNKSHVGENDVEISLRQFLRSCDYPFSLKSLKDNINFWKQLKSVISDYENNAVESAGFFKNKEGAAAKSQKNIKEMQKIFESVAKLTESCLEFMDLGRFESSAVELSKSVNYCDLLARYLTDLSTFILDNLPAKTEDSVEIVTFHSLLERSAVEIVDRLIFHHHVEPGLLEKKAQQLGFNLSASLVAGCCPRLQQIVCSRETVKCPPSDRIVMNEIVADYKSLEQQHPFKVVESILKELLIAFGNYTQSKQVDEATSDSVKNVLTENDLLELRNDFKIQKILEKTIELNFVRLKTLKKNETTPFLINLLNLMTCHCYLSSKLEKTDGIYSEHELYRDLAFVFLGYNVGELGFVSINDLRSFLIGEKMCCGFSSRTIENLKVLNVETDPRIAFLLTSFRWFSPKLVFHGVDVGDSRIDELITAYVENNVTLTNSNLNISELIDRYLERVLMKEFYEGSNEGRQKIKLLFDFLVRHSEGDLQEELKNHTFADLSSAVKTTGRESVLILEYSAPPERVERPETGEIWSGRSLSDSILRHLSQSSRILADVVQKIHEAKEPSRTEVARDVLTEEKSKILDLLFAAPSLPNLSALYDGNCAITALNKCPSEDRLIAFFEKRAAEKDWKACVDVLFALPDYCVFSDLNVKRLKDVVLAEITAVASKEGHEEPWYYTDHILDVNMKVEAVMTNSKYWPGLVCVNRLSSILRDYPKLDPDIANRIKSAVRRIGIYHTMTESCPEFADKTWQDVSDLADSSAHLIIQSLIKINQLELCLQWANLPGILESIRQFIDSEFVLLLFNHLSREFRLIDELLKALPSSTVSIICEKVIGQLTSVPAISHLVQFALRHESSAKYRLVAVSVDMLNLLDLDEQSHLVHLITQPLLIIEQLLMNTRLEALEKVLKKIRQIDDPEIINQDEINQLIASYASKAVEFDFVKAVKNFEKQQSFLLDTIPQTNQEFLVPTEVPDKSQWTPDNQVSLCMCCLLVSFSMFNRRHHCRRCGRVVCGSCSTYRMKVHGYRGVPVRVCQHCYFHHTKAEGEMRCSQSIDTFDSSSFTQEFHYWKLSPDPSRNVMVREEFGFEHAPNVSLCLAIFNLLPCASFSSLLLDESEKLLKLLQLNGKSGNPELDCGVMIKIIRSLIIGAKVKYGQAGLTTGVVCCDRLLSQVDLLHLLIKNHCSRLIPSESLNDHTLRHLRDKLVEEELWDLALEVSTKCGLDRSGVWASWGKICLAAGCWDEARIKFSHCLEQIPKPSRNPPLIEEICRILESATSSLAVRIPAQKNATAQEVTQILSTLKLLSQGKSMPSSGILTKHSIQYDEQVYYLSTYGSHPGLLSFYMKHEEWKIALSYVLQEQLEPDVFLESLFLPSYKTEQQERLKTEILALDPSLESFKKYLCHACVSLKKSGYFNTLYDIQLFMQDFVRAAVTCIHLYQREAKNYGDLLSRASYLHSALRHLEEEMSALNKKTKRLDYTMKLEPKEVNRHMNTIWRQLEVSKFLANCESEGKPVLNLFPDQLQAENDIPTLFDGNPQRILLAALVIISGKNIPEGFGLAFRVIQDHQLNSTQVYVTTGRKLAELGRINDIEALIDSIKTSGASDVSPICDQVLSVSVPALYQNASVNQDLERLIKLIVNVDLKITAFIDSRQLKSAYLLAVKHNRLKDVQRIMEVAEEIGQIGIKKICMKKLGLSSDGSDSGSLPSCDST